MDEPSNPPERRKVIPGDPFNSKTQILGLDNNVAGLLCYLPICAINLIFSIIWIKTEPQENRFLRFHSFQSLVLCGLYLALGIVFWIVTIVFSLIPFLGVLNMLTGAVWLVVTVTFIWQCICGMIDAYKGNMSKIPYIGEIADGWL